MSALRETAELLPPRSPRVGEMVEVRSRRWLVEAVEDTDPEASPRISLACADDDAQGQTLEVYWDFEIDRRLLEQEAWSTIGARGFDPPRYFSAFLHTLRWNCVTATDPNLFQSPFRAGIKIDAYQMSEFTHSGSTIKATFWAPRTVTGSSSWTKRGARSASDVRDRRCRRGA